MADTPLTCNSVQLALVNGERGPRIDEHVKGCEACAFVAELSRSFASAIQVAGGGPLGPALESLLNHALATGERLFGRYRLVKLLGRGGQGAVYLAEDDEYPDRPLKVAIKFVRLDASATDSGAREAAFGLTIQHPNVCRVRHTERHGDVRVIYMEYVDGPTLKQRVGQLGEAEAVRCFHKVCEGVRAAHDKNILHLDLKPHNVLMRGGSEPVVTDFGLAVELDEKGLVRSRGGTEPYMAPEQRRREPVDGRADVFALGMLLSELLGSRRSVYRWVARRATRVAPADRFQSVASLLRALSAVSVARSLVAATVLLLIAWPVASAGARYLPWWRTPTGAFVVGGTSAGGTFVSSAEWYDEKSGIFRSLPPVPDERLCRARALAMADGTVQVVGGGAASGCADQGTTTNQVRVFHPERSEWTVARCQKPCARLPPDWDTYERGENGRWHKSACQPEGPCLLFGRNTFPAVALEDGDAVVLGGCAGGCGGPNALDQTVVMGGGGTTFNVLGVVGERYFRRDGVWRQLPPSAEPHIGGVAINLGAHVLVCGGNDGYRTHTHRCERYDINSTFNGQPAWTDAGALPFAPVMPSLVVIEGSQAMGVWPTESRLWSFDRGWGAPEEAGAKLAQPLDPHTLVVSVLPGGKVVLTGGMQGGAPTAVTQVFERDPKAPGGGRWRLTAPMHQARTGHVAVPLRDGRLLVAGGCGTPPLVSAEVFDPITERWDETGSLSVPRCGAEAVALRPSRDLQAAASP